MGHPRLGRADVRAACREASVAGLPIERVLIGRANPGGRALNEAAAKPTRADVIAAAQDLAAQLAPLPVALSAIATRVSRHCASARGQARDQELAEQLEALRARAWELWKAVAALCETARP